MAAHLRLPAIAAAAVTTAVTTAVLLTRRQATRPVRDAHDAAGPAALCPRADRVAELHAAYLEPAPAETDAHLEQYRNRITSLHPRHGSEHPP
ncbi:hypothetical protein [Streptomyces sp. NRRL F-2664]|uniref:hypothetical protein n=1 Tax=Streptomyces sp. NRRL F-2664 TaxID=1463842 RepID=UPI0004C52BA0|nr:hypothetical protein [Streptomyces sp. NRRL F-2664]